MSPFGDWIFLSVIELHAVYITKNSQPNSTDTRWIFTSDYFLISKSTMIIFSAYYFWFFPFIIFAFFICIYTELNKSFFP